MLASISVHSGCYNTIPQIGLLLNFCVSVLDAVKSKIMVSGEDLLVGWRLSNLHCNLTGWKQLGRSVGSRL